MLGFVRNISMWREDEDETYPGSGMTPERDCIFSYVLCTNAVVHSARGLPCAISGCKTESNVDFSNLCGVVMSSGKRVTLSCLESLSGYAFMDDIFAGGGGMVEFGFGDVRANTRAVATASA